jgi:pyrophosphatase PpaX
MELSKAIEVCFGKPSLEVAAQYNIVNPPAFRESIWQRVLDAVPLVEGYPDLEATLTELRPHSQAFAVVTNSRRGHVTPVLERLALADRFETVVTIEDVAKGKPSPEPLLLALQKLQAAPERAWMIGDSLPDIHAGHAAGVKTIAFSPSENHQFVPRHILEEAKPTFIVDSYKEVLSVIKSYS